MANRDHGHRRYFAFAILVFILSRVIAWLAGIRFQAGDIPHFMHFVDPLLLREEPWSSLFYLHAQPPVFNGILAFAYKFDNPSHALAVLFFLLGLGITMHLGQILIRLGIGPRISLLIALGFAVSPPAILYEHYAFYTYPVVYLLLLCALLFSRLLRHRDFKSGLYFFTAAAVLVLTRATFHLVWLFVPLGLLFLFRSTRFGSIPLRPMLTAMLPGLLLVSAFYTKNLVLYDSFTASTWLGLHLARMTVHRMPKAQRGALIKKGVLGPIAGEDPFAAHEPTQVFSETGLPGTGIDHRLLRARRKSSGAINFHAASYIYIFRLYTREAEKLIRAHPEIYLRNVGRAYRLYLQPAAHWHPLIKNYGVLARYDRFYNRIMHFRVFGAPAGFYILLPLLLAGAFVLAFKLLRDDDFETGVFTLFLAVTAAYITAMSCLFDLGENNRFRFSADPYLLLLLAILIARVRGLSPTNVRT